MTRDSLDDIDRKLLAELARRPRRTLKDLSDGFRASGTALSHEAIRLRIRRLLADASMLPLLNWRLFGLGLVVLTVRLEPGRGHGQRARQGCVAAGAFFTIELLGEADFQAWFLVGTQAELAEVVSRVRGLPGVRDVAFTVAVSTNLHPENLSRPLPGPRAGRAGAR